MILELKDICKSYKQGKLDVPVLNHINFSMERGEYVAIMGPSGSGKSTLMNIIGCLDVPTSGTYLLDGEPILKKKENALADIRLKRIGFVFQNFNLMPRQTALDNVALPLQYAGIRKGERRRRAKEALTRVDLAERITFRPTQLSGGQKQRVAIARAMINEPTLLLADEPTGALDTRSGEQIMQLFSQLHKEGVTILMITHEPEIAAHAQRTVLIRDGQLISAQGEVTKK